MKSAALAYDKIIVYALSTFPLLMHLAQTYSFLAVPFACFTLIF